MKQFFQIEFLEDLDASSYNRISPRVTIQDSPFLSKLLDRKLNWEYYYYDKVRDYYEDILSGDAVGKFMQSNKPVIDYWDPIVFHNTLNAVVSQRFVDVLNRVEVNPNEYFLKPIEITNNKSEFPYYLFFVPSQYYDNIVFPKSVFEISRNSLGMETRTFSAMEDIYTPKGFYKDDTVGFYIRHALLKKELANMDIIRICFETYFSARLLDMMQNMGIHTVGVRTDHYLIVEE